MALKLFCANEGCRWHTESKGGMFRLRDNNWYCDDCAPERALLNDGKNLWEFETLNIAKDPKQAPVQVQSLKHMRQLEREHGVVNVAANYDSKHWSTPPQTEAPKYQRRFHE